MSAQKTLWTEEHVREAAQAMLAAREYIAEHELANDLVSINEARILANETGQEWAEEAKANLDTPSSPGLMP